MHSYWIIHVAGYGSFIHEGDEGSAEEMRKHKASWEGGVGWKRPATVGEVTAGKASQKTAISESLTHAEFMAPLEFTPKEKS